jgi:hypothetical protein
MGNIFSDNPVFATTAIIALLGILASHRLMMYRERKKRFDAAADEYRRVFDQALIDLQRGIFGKLGFGGSLSDEVFKTHRVAYLNFRPYQHGVYQTQYDKAWDEYCHAGLFPREELIEHLLELTEYRWRRHIIYLWQKYTSKSPPPSKIDAKKLLKILLNLIMVKSHYLKLGHSENH